MSQSSQAIYSLPALIAMFFLAGSAWAQEAESAAGEDIEPAAAEPTANNPTDEDSADEEVNVDDGSYVDAEEEDFRPSEEISSDQSITFPTDI